jgi:hypothetical protein
MREVGGSITLIEGVDAVGKSTYAKWLYANYPRVALLHAGPPRHVNAFSEYVEPLKLARAGWNIVCDRWHLGELVWPAVFKRESIYSGQVTFIEVESAIQLIGVPVTAVYMHRNRDEILAELDSRLETPEGLDYATNLYELALEVSQFEWNITTLPGVIDGGALRISG